MTQLPFPQLAEVSATRCAVCGKDADDHFLHNTVAGVVAGTYGPDGNTIILCGAQAIASALSGEQDMGPMAYAGRKRACGCVVQVAVDDPGMDDNGVHVAAALAEMAATGLIVERMTIEAARQAFTTCPHGEGLLAERWPQMVQMTAESIADVIELAAALDVGNDRVGSEAVRQLLTKLRTALAADTGHYLILRTFNSSPDDFVTCATALGVADHIAAEGATKVMVIEKAACPNCGGAG